jgi:signal transduction histidine kinase
VDASASDLIRLLLPLDEEAVASKILTAVRTATGVDVAYIASSERPDAVRIAFGDGLLTDSLRGVEVVEGLGLGGRAIEERRPVVSADYPTDDSLTSDYRAHVEPEKLRGILSVPIVAGDELHGLLYLGNRITTDFGDRIIDAAVSAAEQVGLAFRLAERARYDAELAIAEERRRVAVALHDSVGALLFGIRASLRTLEQRMGEDQAAQVELARIEARAGEAAAALHSSLDALHATATEAVLGVGLRADAHHFAERSGVRARVAFTTEVPALEPARVQAIVNAVREALLNVEKHAGASSVMITVFADQAAVSVLVADDGVGLGAASAAQGSGLGIATAREGLARLGGGLIVEPNSDAGTSVRT